MKNLKKNVSRQRLNRKVSSTYNTTLEVQVSADYNPTAAITTFAALGQNPPVLLCDDQLTYENDSEANEIYQENDDDDEDILRNMMNLTDFLDMLL